MKISKIAEIVEGSILTAENKTENEIFTACASDMMSDVLAYVHDAGALITGLANPQIIRTAIMMDLPCVVLVRGKQVDEEVLKLAETNGIVIISSAMRMFEAAGRLYAAGLRAQ